MYILCLCSLTPFWPTPCSLQYTLTPWTWPPVGIKARPAALKTLTNNFIPSSALAYQILPVLFRSPMFSRAIHTIRLAASAAYKEPLAPEVFEPIITSFAASQMRKSGKTLRGGRSGGSSVRDFKFMLSAGVSYSYLRCGVHWSPREDPTDGDAHLTVKFLDANNNHITTKHVPIRGTKRPKTT